MRIKTNIHWLAVHVIHGIKIGRQYTSKILGLNYFLEFADKQSVGQSTQTFPVIYLFSSLSFVKFKGNMRFKYDLSFLI